MPDWNSLFFQRNFHDHDIRVGMKGKTVDAPKIFLNWIQSNAAHNLTTDKPNDGN